jgi:hypothetical protein
MALNIPLISYNMLIDALGNYTILYSSPRHPKQYRWVSSIHWERGLVNEQDMVFVCQQSAAEKAAELYPSSLLIVISDKQNVEQLMHLSNPLIVVEESPSTSGLLQKIQNYFLAIQSWHNELYNTVSSPETLRHILNISSHVLDTPLLLYNEKSQLEIQCLLNFSPLASRYLERQKEIVNRIRMLGKEHLKIEGNEGDLFVEGRLLGQSEDSFLLVAPFERKPSAGQEDLIEEITKALTSRPELQKGFFQPTKYSLYALMDSLIHKQYVSKGQLGDYALNIGVPLDAEFRLLCFVNVGNEQRANLSGLAESLKPVNRGMNATVIFHDRLYILLYSQGLDNSLSDVVLREQLMPYCDPRQDYLAFSQVFDELSNLGFAYEEIQLVITYRKHIDLAYWFTASEHSKLVYNFEEALQFVLLKPNEIDPALKDFAFSHTILDKLVKEDVTNGGNDVRILATYIHYERKATIVAEKLHMHRNTVLYRIGKIEKRFGLDFDKSWSRNRVRSDLLILYEKLEDAPVLFKKITGISQKDI